MATTTTTDKDKDNHTDPEVPGGVRESLLAIRRVNPRTVEDARAELAEVEAELDSGEEYTYRERAHLHRRRRVLARRVNGDARYRVVGAKSGRLTWEEECAVAVHRAIDALETIGSGDG